jgi:hypothetical protein
MIAVSAVMFGAPFLLLAGLYDALPAELPVLRNVFAGSVIVAAKSPFTVFRVPLMNLTHGLMAAVMLAHASDVEEDKGRASYFALFSTLLFAIGLKSIFEALELGGMAPPLGSFRGWAAAGTVVSVVGGLMLAFFRSRTASIPWRELRLSTRDKTVLAVLLVCYLAIVTRSFFIGYRS